MLELDPMGVEHLSGRKEAEVGAEPFGLPLAVDLVPKNREPDVLKVDADLMGSPGVQDRLNEGCPAVVFKPLIAGMGVPTRPVGDGHSFAMGGMAGDVRTDLPPGGVDAATGDGEIGFFGAALGELIGEPAVGGIVLCHHDAAAGVLVQSMDDAWTGDPADAAQLALAVGQERVNEGAGRVSRRGMNAHARRFVDDQQVIVLKEDIKGDGLRFEFARHRRGKDHLNAIAVFRKVAGLGFSSADRDVFPVNEPRPLGPGNLRHLLVKPGVQPEARFGFGHIELEGVTHPSAPCQTGRGRGSARRRGRRRRAECRPRSVDRV